MLSSRSTTIGTLLIIVTALTILISPAVARPAALAAPADDPGADPIQLASPSLETGLPGTSYRYEHTFGETEVPYLSDTDHINYPWGLGTDGTSVWIGELWGNRALKYTQAGNFQMQIGLSGINDIYGTVLWSITDVAVDVSGFVWIVDGDASHIVKFDAEGQIMSELGTIWGSGTENDRFNNPQSIVFDATGNIYVSDGSPWWDPTGGNHRLQIFDSGGSYLATIGQTGVCGTGNDQLCGPRHIAIYGNQLFIADAGNQRVQIFDISTPTSPTYVATLGVTGVGGDDNAHFNVPSGVAVDAGYIYVADLWNSRVQVFNRLTRAYVTTIGTGEGSGNDEFWGVADVAVDASGYLYVADFVNIRVQQFSGAGGVWSYVRTFGETGVPYLTDDAHYNHPSGVAVADDGSIYLTEENGHRLVKLDANGAQLWTVGQPGVKGDWDTSNDSFSNPSDVALDSTGRVYVADRYHGRVQVYNADSSYVTSIGDLLCPGGIGIDAQDYVYVADSCQSTLHIYDSSLALVATLGESGVPGSDNAHFNSPDDVAIDSHGNIYVADSSNQRVQIFAASFAYLRTMGETGVPGYSFDLFNNPNGVEVDAADHLYVSDCYNQRIQVFDANGAYLTTIGGAYGTRTGMLKGQAGVGVDRFGSVYVADWGNHRLQKYALGVPGWRQVNINGFGDRDNRTILSAASFAGSLYTGVYDPGGTQLWRGDGEGDWAAITLDGFGDASNLGIDHLLEFNGYLYAGTWNETDTGSNGGQLWRSPTGDPGTWVKVVDAGFGNPENAEIFRLGVYGDMLYASTWNSSSGGSEIWRSSTGNAVDWSQVLAGGGGDGWNSMFDGLVSFNGALYASSYNGYTGAEVWRSSDGSSGSWSQVNVDGFGDIYNRIATVEPFGGYLYAATYNYTQSDNPGTELWRCQVCDGSDWSELSDVKGFGDPENRHTYALVVHDAKMYAFTLNLTDGMEIWQTGNGTQWQKVVQDGLGDSNNRSTYWDNSVTIHAGSLFVGTSNYANAAELWRMVPQHQVLLPMLLNK